MYKTINGISLKDERFKHIEESILMDVLNYINSVNNTDKKWKDFYGSIDIKNQFKSIISESIFKNNIKNQGILLYGAPGNGKTYFGTSIQDEFPSIKLIRIRQDLFFIGRRTTQDITMIIDSVFEIAKCFDQSIIFIDEFESIFTNLQFVNNETKSSIDNHIKTQLIKHIIEINKNLHKIIIMGEIYNLPKFDTSLIKKDEHKYEKEKQIIDEIKYFSNLIYFQNPNYNDRKLILKGLLKSLPNNLTKEGIKEIIYATDRFTRADLNSLIKSSTMIVINELMVNHQFEIDLITEENIRPVDLIDFRKSLQCIKTSYHDSNFYSWNKLFNKKAYK